MKEIAAIVLGAMIVYDLSIHALYATGIGERWMPFLVFRASDGTFVTRGVRRSRWCYWPSWAAARPYHMFWTGYWVTALVLLVLVVWS